jgi:mannosyltransferase
VLLSVVSHAGWLERTRSGAVRPGWLRPVPARLDPVLVAVLAVAVSLAGASRPSFWADEAATISAAFSRSLPELWQMLGHIDAVHGLYYLLMHGWSSVFPPTEFWSRVPSGLAVGGAAAGLVVLAKQFSPRSAALCCGAVFAILPRTTWAGIEARPYALDLMAAVWLSVLLVHAARRAKVSAWLAYGVVLVVSTLLDVYLVLMILVYACFIVAVRRSRTVVVPFAITSVVAVGVVSPFIMVVIGQAHQISCAPIQRQTVVDVGVEQYFERSVPFTLLAALVIAAAIVLRLRTPRRPAASKRDLLILSVAWMVIPTAAIVVFSAAITSIYTSKYLSFTAPAMALMLGRCIVAVAATPKRAAALVAAFAVAAIPNYLFAQRGPYAKLGMDYSQVADLITRESAQGDCLLLDDTVTWKFRPTRALMAARPAAYHTLIDVGLWKRAGSHGELFDTNLAPFVVADRISRCRVLWIIAEHDPTLPAHQQSPALAPGPRFSGDNAFWVPHDLGFRLVERWQFSLAQVIKETR